MKPKPVEMETCLVREGQPAALIAVPEDPAYRPVAEQLQDFVEKRTSARLRIVKGSSLVTKPVLWFTSGVLRSPKDGGLNLLLLGDLSSNPAIARLYMDYVAFEDAAYPGRGGHTVRTLIDPTGSGWNAVVLGGGGVAEVSDAVREFEGLLQLEGSSLFSEYFVRVTWGEGPALAEIKKRNESAKTWLPGWANRLRAPNSPEYQASNPGKPPLDYVFDLLNSYLMHGGLHYALSGDSERGGASLAPSEWARGVGKAMDALYENLAWVEAHRQGSYDDHYAVEIWLRAWQQVANCPYLTEQQREHGAAVMAFLASQMGMYRCDPDAYGKTSYRILSRHEYSGVFAGDALCQFVERHCNLSPELARELAAHRKNFRKVIKAMLGTYTTGFDHKWTLDGHWALLQVATEEPHPAYVSSGLARRNADYATMCINNAGDWVNFGADNVGPTEGYDAWQILGRAETLFHDGTYQWWLDQRMKRPVYKTFIMSFNWLAHWYQTRGASTPPTHLVGLNRALVPEPEYEDLIAGRGRLYAGLPVVNDVPLEKTFNKISFRDGLGEDDQYLLLDGFGGTPYSGNDANEICEYSRYGQRLLVELEVKPEPFYRNTVSVSRGNAGDPVGTFARLLDMADVGPLVYTRTEVDPLSGCRNVRHLFMEKGRYFVAIDEVVVLNDDEHFLTCNFRGLGVPTLDARSRTWKLGNEKADLFLQNVTLPTVEPAPQYTTSVRTSGVTSAEWRAMPVQVLRETAARSFHAGEKYRFANLFCGVRAGQKPGSEAVALSREAIVVRGPETVVYGAPWDEEARVGNLKIRASAFRLSRDSAQFISLTRLTLGGQTVLTSPEPVTLSLDLRKGLSHWQSPKSRCVRTIAWKPEWERSASFKETESGMSLPNRKRISVSFAEVSSAVAEILEEATGVRAEPTEPVDGAASPLIIHEARTLLPEGAPIVDAALFDLNSDERDEVVCARKDGHLVAVDQEGHVLLDLACGPSPLMSLWAGKLEERATILGGGEDGRVQCYDGRGQLRWIHQNTHWSYVAAPAVYSITVGDFQGTGQPQIALGCHGGVSMLNTDGAFVRFTTVYAHCISTLRAVALFGDKKEWLMAHSWGGGFKLVDPVSGQVVDTWAAFWGGGGNPQVVPSSEADHSFVHTGDIGVGFGKLLRESWERGSRSPQEVWRQNSWYKRSDGATRSALVRDLDGDGKREILCGVETGFLVCYDTEGKPLWKRLIGTPINALVAGDVTGDGKEEILVAGDQPALTVFDSKMNRVGSWSPSPARPIDRLWASVGRILATTRAGEVVSITLKAGTE
ncbi:MAG: VCBS repeat-containing protein [Armatimonadetes bacterium]|nr:VCBS repeat-containing protein [Armatimonadota bacterium]